MNPPASPGVPAWLKVHPEIAEALVAGDPVVALESTVITHGLPQPLNLDLAQQMEHEVRSQGALPATAAVWQGQIHLGLAGETLEQLSLSEQMVKISRRDLGIARTRRLSGGTTVAATMFIAHSAGVPVFATGGIGGVHRGGTGDVSADLPELARTPVTVVSSGAKSILDLPRTLEWLEMAGVPVLGWQCDTFPAFFSQNSGFPVQMRVETAEDAAAVIRSHWTLGLNSGVLLCVPCPSQVAVPEEKLQALVDEAEREAHAQSVSGPELTPFLLNRLSELSGGETLRANLALLRNNARTAASVAKALGYP
jgi:pseudouridine-5'-phosphate glycosidase